MSIFGAPSLRGPSLGNGCAGPQPHEHSDIARACAELVAEAEAEARSSAPDNITALLLCVNQEAAEDEDDEQEMQAAEGRLVT